MLASRSGPARTPWCWTHSTRLRSVLSKETWEKFEGPFSKRIADAVRDEGGLVVVHNCGGGVYFDAVIKWISPIAISHAYPAFDCTTWEEHAVRSGREVVTIGYSDPANISFLLRRRRSSKIAASNSRRSRMSTMGSFYPPAASFRPTATC